MKRIGLVVILLVLCLAGVETAYAGWTEDICIGGRDGTVSTGNVDVCWAEVGSWDTEPPGKDHSHIECVLDSTDRSSLNVVVAGAYPCIHYYSEVEIVNVGTIPVYIRELAASNPYAWLEVEILGLETAGAPDGSVQLYPGESQTVVIHVYLLDDAPQSVTAEFGVTWALYA